MDTTNTFYQTASSIWNDPVWSKVIAVAITAVAAWIFGWFKSNKQVALPPWAVLAGILSVAIVAGFTLTWLTIGYVALMVLGLWLLSKKGTARESDSATRQRVDILSPRPHSTVKPEQGRIRFSCKFEGPPELSRLYVFVERDGHWMPQPTQFRQSSTRDHLEYSFDAWFNRFEHYQVHIVHANDLGCYLISYYEKVVKYGQKNRELAADWGIDAERAKAIPKHLGIEMPTLPSGLTSLAHVSIQVSSS